MALLPPTSRRSERMDELLDEWGSSEEEEDAFADPELKLTDIVYAPKEDRVFEKWIGEDGVERTTPDEGGTVKTVIESDWAIDSDGEVILAQDEDSEASGHDREPARKRSISAGARHGRGRGGGAGGSVANGGQPGNAVP